MCSGLDQVTRTPITVLLCFICIVAHNPLYLDVNIPTIFFQLFFYLKSLGLSAGAGLPAGAQNHPLSCLPAGAPMDSPCPLDHGHRLGPDTEISVLNLAQPAWYQGGLNWVSPRLAQNCMFIILNLNLNEHHRFKQQNRKVWSLCSVCDKVYNKLSTLHESMSRASPPHLNHNNFQLCV